MCEGPYSQLDLYSTRRLRAMAGDAAKSGDSNYARTVEAEIADRSRRDVRDAGTEKGKRTRGG